MAKYSIIDQCLGEGNLARLMEEMPETVLACLGLAISEVFYEKHALPRIKMHVRLTHCGEPIQFKDLKAFQVGKLICLKANVVRVAAVRPLPTQIAFECAKCLQIFPLPISDGVYRTPNKCHTSQCTSKVFAPMRESRETVYVNSQRIRLQEVIEGGAVDDEGRIPRTIEAELTNDLVDEVVPGEVITLWGVLKSVDVMEKGQTNSTSSLFIDVVSLDKFKDKQASSIASGALSPAESFPHLPEILSIGQGKHTLSTLVKSFCPRIFGNDLVKFGILLAMFGGSKRDSAASSSGRKKMSIRSDPHVLIVGDPGLGKSQLLNFASAVAPRSVYVSANTATAVGLTATVQDGGLEAGALVLADQGCCCIDEFDKIGTDGWRSLLDAMEQQSVNIAKAGVVSSLPARTSIIAAANPVGGHYNKGKSVLDNLKMDAALLSRFDLVFILLDKPNVDLDKVLSEHVLGSVKVEPDSSKKGSLKSFLTQHNPEPSESILERLSAPFSGPLMTPALLREYIQYARVKLTPKMTEEAAEVLKAFYLDLRKSRTPDENLPITTRHLESLIRLSEARAKMELRGYVSIEDAQDVIDLVRYCTADIGGDRSAAGVLGGKAPRKGSKSAGLKRFVSELIKISSRTSEIDYTTQQLQSLYDVMKITELPFRELLDALNEHGYLLKRSNAYRLLTT